MDVVVMETGDMTDTVLAVMEIVEMQIQTILQLKESIFWILLIILLLKSGMHWAMDMLLLYSCVNHRLKLEVDAILRAMVAAVDKEIMNEMLWPLTLMRQMPQTRLRVAMLILRWPMVAIMDVDLPKASEYAFMPFCQKV